MLDVVLSEEGSDFRDEVEVVLEEIRFEHRSKILRNLLSFLHIINPTWKQLFRLSAISAISGT